MLKIGVFLVEKELKFKIYNKLLNKCFKVTRIDYMDEVVYYFDREKNDEDIYSIIKDNMYSIRQIREEGRNIILI